MGTVIGCNRKHLMITRWTITVDRKTEEMEGEEATSRLHEVISNLPHSVGTWPEDVSYLKKVYFDLQDMKVQISSATEEQVKEQSPDVL